MQPKRTHSSYSWTERPLGRNVFRILLAEDDQAMRQLLVETLRKNGFSVTACSNGVELLEKLQIHLSPSLPEKYDLAISDISMPWATGMSILEGLHDQEGFPPMIIITAFGDEETHKRARDLGAVAMLDKPFELDVLLELVHGVVERRAREIS